MSTNKAPPPGADAWYYTTGSSEKRAVKWVPAPPTHLLAEGSKITHIHVCSHSEEIRNGLSRSENYSRFLLKWAFLLVLLPQTPSGHSPGMVCQAHPRQTA